MSENVTLTNMCMVCDGDKVLVQDRLDPAWPGITFPGGHVEEGESFTDAVIREVWEETGLTITSPRLVGIKDWFSAGKRYVVLFYRADRFSGVLHSSEEGEVRWEALADLPKLPLAPDMGDMLRVFLEEDLSEFYYRIEDGNWIQELK
jgi:8-oxo-dGTP diphosphatase